MKISYSIRLSFLLLALTLFLLSFNIIKIQYGLFITVILLLSISLLKFYKSIIKLEKENTLLREQPKLSVPRNTAAENYKKLFENNPSPMLVYDLDSLAFVSVNDAAIRHYGYSQEEFLSMKITDIHPQKDLQKLFENLSQPNQPFEISNSWHHLKKNGSIINVEVISHSLPEQNGKKTRLVMIKDVTSKYELERELEESEHRFSAFMESIPIGAFIQDESSRLVYTNKYFQKLHSTSGSDFLGKTVLEIPFIPNDIAYKILEDDKKVLKEGILNITETIPDISGNIHVYNTIKFLINSGDQKQLIGCYQIDITDKIKSQEDLIKSKQEYQAFFEDDLTGDFISTPSGELKTCNPAFLKIFGFKSIEEAKSTNMKKLYTDPEVRENLLYQLTANKRLDDYEIITQTIDGKKLYLIENIKGIFNDSDELVEIRGYIINNTERKLAEIELRKLSRAVEQSPVSILITDTEGNIQYVNPKFESVTGYTYDEVLGKNPRILKSGDKSFDEYKLLWDTISSGKEWQGEFQNKKKNGELYWEIAKITPVFNSSGDIENYLAVKEDITERKKSEELLIEGEKKFRTLFESANEGTIILQNLKFIDCNEKALQIYKATKEQLIGNTPLDFSPEYQPDGIKSEIKAKQKIEAALNGTPQVFEWLHTKTDGSLFFAEINLIKIEINGVNYIHAFVRDISELKEAAETLKISEKKYKDIFNWAPIGIYQSTPNGKIITANSSIIKILGYTDTEEFLKCNMHDVYYHTEDRINLLEKYDKPGAGAGIDIELLWRKKDGSPVWISLTSYAVKDSTSKTIYYEGFVYDITARKASEDTLRESEERYRLLLQQSVEAIYLYDPATKNLIDTNNAFSKLLGYTREETRTLTLYDFVDHEQGNIENYINKSVENEGFMIGERKWRCKNGSIIDVEVTASKISQNGKTVLFIIARDITERKRAENELIEAKEKAEEMNKLKNIFLTNMSHELRTPLIGILGYSEMLKSNVSINDQKEMANMIYESGSRLGETLNLILELSQTEYENKAIQLNLMNINSLLHKFGIPFRSLAAQKELELRIITGKEEIYAEVDQEMFRKVVNNLLSNAVKFTSKGKITLSTRFDNNKIKIIVSDSGIGIDAEDQQRIFEPFRQASEGLNRDYEGTGLGLTIAKKYVELMNGRICVESTPGEGSTFTIELPVPKCSGDPNMKTAQNTEDDSTRNFNSISMDDKKRILVVEDDIINARILNSFLQNEFSVEIVNCHKDALKKTKEKIYDCILLNIDCNNGMNGLDTILAIKKDGKQSNVQIIAMTSSVSVEKPQQFLSSGVSHYMLKPIKKDDLLSIIREELISN